jgi:hypothetical protein
VLVSGLLLWCWIHYKATAVGPNGMEHTRPRGKLEML